MNEALSKAPHLKGFRTSNDRNQGKKLSMLILFIERDYLQRMLDIQRQEYTQTELFASQNIDKSQTASLTSKFYKPIHSYAFRKRQSPDED